ncbi:MAG: molybdenum cofactor guanylyltransferase MobA [Rhizobiaceae bacterium]|nr:molybdenum cofactor guanylyltransferase MobA [Rhizobiaceae bacterium]
MSPNRTVAVILAGGQASRLGGGDKPLRRVAGRTILDLVIERLRPQVGQLALNANGDASRFDAFGLPVIPDKGPQGQAGPLTGILAAMDWASALKAANILTVAGDTPFFPRDLAERLVAAVENAPEAIAVAKSAQRSHPVFALWPVSMRADLRRFLSESDNFSVAGFQGRYQTISVDFPVRSTNGREVDPFFNINTQEDLLTADQWARSDRT